MADFTSAYPEGSSNYPQTSGTASSSTYPLSGGSAPSYEQSSASTSTAPQSSTTNNVDSAASKASATLASARDTVVTSAQSAMETIQNHPTHQQISNGPMAENVRTQANLTSSEFQNIANSRKPGAPAATGQPLTNYHSMFYTLMSWENPRATAIVFASSVAFIFMTRYLNVLHYIFKFSYIVLGVTASLEIAGKLLFDDGLASKMRPRKYWTIPKKSLESSLDDVEQLLNFFVIESQRILYAENVYATIAVFLAALMSFGLIKIVPVWGLALMADTVMFLGPLVYIKNREVIDHQVEHMSDVVSAQTHQLRDIAAHHASVATESVKTYASEYSHKAQELMGSAKAQAADTINQGSAKAQEYADTAKAQTNSAINQGSAKAQEYADTAKAQTNSAINQGSAKAQGYADSAKAQTSSAVNNAGSASSSEFPAGAKTQSVGSSDYTTTAAIKTDGVQSGEYQRATVVTSDAFPVAPKQTPTATYGVAEAHPAF